MLVIPKLEIDSMFLSNNCLLEKILIKINSGLGSVELSSKEVEIVCS